MSKRPAWGFLDGSLAVGLAALAVAATWPTWKDIFTLASRSAEQSHIFLAPIIAVWLFWVRRERLRWARPQWTMLGPAAVAAGWLLSWWGFGAGVMIAEHFGALLIVVGAAATVIGAQPLWLFLPAVGALLFLMPVPGTIRQAISIPLQQATAVITHFGLELVGAPVARSGNVLSINGRDVAVAEACNGMRMVAALGIVTYAFVFSVPMRQGVRLGLLAISPAVALLCNVIRLTPIVLFYGYAEQSLASAFHDLSGWLMLFVALGILWAILGLLRWLDLPIAPYAVAGD